MYFVFQSSNLMYFVFEIRRGVFCPSLPVGNINFNSINQAVVLKILWTTRISKGLTLWYYRYTPIISLDLLTLRPNNPRGNRHCKSLDTHLSCWRSCICSVASAKRTTLRISYPPKRLRATTVPRWTWKKFRKN